jgi:polar amino acid transport system substrate-binding protein
MNFLYIYIYILTFSQIALANDNIVTLATLNWEPYIGQTLKNNGFTALIVKEAFKAEGYDTKFVFTPWARSVEEAKKGKLDGLMPEYYDDSPNGRLKDFVYSNSFFEGPVGFLALKSSKIKYVMNSNLNKVYDNLKKYKFGVVRDYINEKNFDARTYEISSSKGHEGRDLGIEIANSDEINVKKLDKKRIDLIFIDKLVAFYYINKLFMNDKENFEFLEPAIHKNALYIAFSKKAKDSDKKKEAFNKGLEKIKSNGILQKLISNAH